MLVSPKWQAMWLESQHCSKNIINMNLPSQQTQKVLEDLIMNCCSPNKAVQLEALKCWGIWINNQNPDDWKVKTVCFTAVRPLISKRLQPLHKDVDIYKVKLSLMWALLGKVQNIMHLEGPQYILEVFLQSCLTWLSSISDNECRNEIPSLIFQLLLGILKKNETPNACDKNLFSPLSTDILHSNKVFYHLADKFQYILSHWRKVRDKKIILKLWTHFLERCELSCEHIQIPVWHKIFKLACQICSEKSESVKERLNFLHSCATTLKSALTSSKFIDFGNLMTTPCEALFKKLVELCTSESNECCDVEMFMHSKETCQVLADRSVAVGGFDLCINVLDILEEFCHRTLYWGVWCGLVYCYKVQLSNIDKKNMTKIQTTFYRKLRGVAVNFELDRDNLHEDCITEVEENIEILNINCFCGPRSKIKTGKVEDCNKMDVLEVMNPNRLSIVPVTPTCPIRGEILNVSLYKNTKLPTKTCTIRIDLIKNILDKIGVNSAQPLFNGLFDFRFLTLKLVPPKSVSRSPLKNNLSLKVRENVVKNVTLPCIKAKPQPLLCTPKKASRSEKEAEEEEVISTPKTRSRKRAEEEERKREMENRKRKKRKSFEIIVQEIVRKNKERKTEKNGEGRTSPIKLRKKQNKNLEKKSEKFKNKKEKTDKENRNKPVEVSKKRKLKNPKEGENRKKKEERSDGKLENYFKVLTKKSGNETKKEENKPKKGKKSKTKTGSCCNVEKESERKGEIAWRQTSLKTMMNEKSKAGKVKNTLRTRNKVTEEKAKIKKENKKVTGSPLAKLSPFKEVFHDHEYAKIEPETFERALFAKKALKDYKKCKNEASVVKKIEIEETKGENEQVLEEPKKSMVEEKDVEEEKTKISCPLDSVSVVKVEESTPVSQPPVNDVIVDETHEEFKETMTTTPTRKAKKRIKMLSSLKPSKKIKLDEEEKIEIMEKENLEEELPIEITEKENLDEKLPIEITEKENYEEKQTECVKKEKNCGSPKGINGMISSRALRMIALVPESTKSGQSMQWESSSRVELSKCKKAPNVDKNSRASKMLALLSENVVEVESNEHKLEDLTSNKGLVSTPNVKTPVSSLKSPSSIKKRRSIRFDDAKNETVLYQTDTPPSQILEEKEKCRRIKPNEIILNLP